MQHIVKNNFFIWFFVGACFIGNASADTCRNGYNVADKIAPDTFAPVYKGTCESGYTKYEFLPHNIYPVFQENKCGAGKRSIGNGVCADLTSGNCKNNYFDITTSEETMVSMSHGFCKTGYTKIEQPYSSFYIIESQSNHCGAGYHPTADGSCVAWSTDGCESGQYAYTDSLVTIKPLFDKTCESGYTPYHVQERACFNGEVRTYADTCSPTCTALEFHTFRVGNLRIPLYSKKTTEYALVFGTPENKCYMNLLQGRLQGTINVKSDDGIYHAVD